MPKMSRSLLILKLYKLRIEQIASEDGLKINQWFIKQLHLHALSLPEIKHNDLSFKIQCINKLVGIIRLNPTLDKHVETEYCMLDPNYT